MCNRRQGSGKSLGLDLVECVYRFLNVQLMDKNYHMPIKKSTDSFFPTAKEWYPIFAFNLILKGKTPRRYRTINDQRSLQEFRHVRTFPLIPEFAIIITNTYPACNRYPFITSILRHFFRPGNKLLPIPSVLP